MKKKVISMFLTACTVSVMVVGGGSNLVMADDAETVTLMGWYDEDDMNPILEKVNEQMDGKYVIEYTYVANTDYNNVLSTQLASGEGPDIIMDGTNYPAEIKAGNVEDISDYDFVKEFNEAGMSLCSADGKIYGIPSYGWFSGIWCNASILEECGVEIPKTFDELLADCKLLQDQEIIPIAMGGDWPILRYFAQVPFRLTGNEYIENAVSGEGSFGEEAGLKGAQFIQDIAQYFQEGWSSADYDTMIDLFASGQAAIMYNGTWALDQADMIGEDGNIKDNMGYFTMPTYSDVTTATDFFANSGIGTAIRTDAVDDEMKAWMKYLLEHYADASLSYNQLPSVMPDEETMQSLPKVYQQIIEDVSNVKEYAKCWDVVIDSALVEPLEKETVILALGQETPEEWAANMDEYVKNQK